MDRKVENKLRVSPMRLMQGLYLFWRSQPIPRIFIPRITRTESVQYSTSSGSHQVNYIVHITLIFRPFLDLQSWVVALRLVAQSQADIFGNYVGDSLTRCGLEYICKMIICPKSKLRPTIVIRDLHFEFIFKDFFKNSTEACLPISISSFKK